MHTWPAFDVLRYGVAWAESAALWGALLLLASRRRGVLRWGAGFAFVLVGALALGTERYFYDQFETYLNADAALFGAAFPASLRGQLAADAFGLAAALALPLAYFAALAMARSEEHTSELQSLAYLVCRLLLEK